MDRSLLFGLNGPSSAPTLLLIYRALGNQFTGTSALSWYATNPYDSLSKGTLIAPNSG
jgi:hypothetical protein